MKVYEKNIWKKIDGKNSKDNNKIYYFNFNYLNYIDKKANNINTG